MGFWSASLLASLTGGLGLTPRAVAEYDAHARSPFWLVEVDVPRCSLTYTSAPCTATDKGDGARCCYSRHTCQDTANFTTSTTTYRFIDNGVSPARAPLVYQSYGAQLWPLISKVSPLTQHLDTSAGFTLPGEMTFHLDDLGSQTLVGTDTPLDVPVLDLDKSSSLRNTTKAGQFWRRFVSIWPNYRNFNVRLLRGFATQTFTIYDLETKWRGKLANIGFETSGGVTIKAASLYGSDEDGIEKDAPPAPATDKSATADASRSATSITVADGTLFTNPASVAYAVHLRHVGLSGRAEIMKLTAVSGDTLTVSRAKFGTLAEPVLKGDQLDEVIPYFQTDGQEGWHPSDIIIDLMRRAGMAEDHIDTAQIAGAGHVLNGVRLPRLVDEPSAVKKLATEVCELVMGSVFSGESLRMRWSVPAPPRPGSAVGEQTWLADASSLNTLTDNPHVLTGTSVSAYSNENERLTHCLVKHGKRTDDSSGSGEWANYVLAVNIETFASGYYGNSDSDRKQKTIETEWLPIDTAPASYRDADVSVGVANALASRWIARRAHAPTVFKLSTEMRFRTWKLGNPLKISTADKQSAIGAAAATLCRLMERTDDGTGVVKMTLHALNMQDRSATTGLMVDLKFMFIAHDSITDDHATASTAEKQYGYLGDASNLVSSGTVTGYVLA